MNDVHLMQRAPVSWLLCLRLKSRQQHSDRVQLRCQWTFSTVGCFSSGWRPRSRGWGKLRDRGCLFALIDHFHPTQRATVRSHCHIEPKVHERLVRRLLLLPKPSSILIGAQLCCQWNVELEEGWTDARKLSTCSTRYSTVYRLRLHYRKWICIIASGSVSYRCFGFDFVLSDRVIVCSRPTDFPPKLSENERK